MDYDPFQRTVRSSMSSHYAANRDMAYAGSHVPHEQMRTYPVGRKGSRDTPSGDYDNDANSNQVRRRIAVACGRCRKRKIKCSGDPGNGTGCQNCRSSGADVNQCLFNRVNSVECAVSPWPSASSTIQLHSYGANSQAGSGMTAAQGTYSAYARGYGPPSWTRQSYQPSYPPTYSDDLPIDSYGLQNSSCLPGHGQEGMGVPSGTYDSIRSWYGTNQRTTVNSAFSYDHDPALSYGGAQLPYHNGSIARSQTASTEGFTPLTMTTMHSSLPQTLVERRLPMPLSQGISMTPVSSVDSLQMRAPPASYSTNLTIGGIYSRTAMPWNSETSSSENSHGSISSLSSSNLDMGPPSRGAALSAPNQEQALLGYIPITDSPETSPTTIPSLTNSCFGSMMESTSTPTLYTDRRYSVSTSGLPGLIASDGTLSRHDSSSNLYSYSTDSSSKRKSDSSLSEGTLLSGERYTPLHQPQPQHTSGIEALRSDSFEQRIPTASKRASTSNRTSVSSLRSRA